MAKRQEICPADELASLSRPVAINGLKKESTLPNNQGRTMKKPPPPLKPKPTLPQKPSTIGAAKGTIKPDVNKKASLKRQTSGPKPQIPVRPPSLKKVSPKPENANVKISNQNQTDSIQNTKIVSPRDEERRDEDGDIPPLLRTKSGPVKPTNKNVLTGKPRASSVQEKENVVPKPLPRPKNIKMDSFEENPKPVPPPRTKKNGKLKQSEEESLVDSDGEKPKEESTSKAFIPPSVSLGQKIETIENAFGKGVNRLEVDDAKKIETVESKKGLIDEKESTEKNIEAKRPEDKVETISVEEQNKVKTSDIVSNETDMKTTKHHPYENVTVFKKVESSSDEKMSENNKRRRTNPYENVPSPLKSAVSSSGDREVCVEAEETVDDIPSKDDDIKKEDDGSTEENDYVNITDGNDQSSPDYVNANLHLDLASDLLRDGDRHDFMMQENESSNATINPMDFQHLRIDADDVVNESAYVEMPRKGSLLSPQNSDFSPTLHAVDSLQQESYYQSPSSSPIPSARRSLFTESNLNADQKRIRRPPPQPPLMDNNFNVLRSKAKPSESKFSSPGKSESPQPAPRKGSVAPDDNIYVVPSNDTLKDSSGGDTESLKSFHSANSSVPDDFSHHVYKEPSIYSTDSSSTAATSSGSFSYRSNISNSTGQEYSVPTSIESVDDYVEPENFRQRAVCTDRDSKAIVRSSYGESDSSGSTRSSGGANLAHEIDRSHSDDDDYERIMHCSPKMDTKSRGDSLGYQSAPEYVDMSPAKEDNRSSIVGDYLQPMSPPTKPHPVRKRPARPAPPAPIRPPRRPEGSPTPPALPTLVVPADIGKGDSLDGRYERIQSLRREMGLPPIAKGEELSDSESESDEELKGTENEEKKKDGKEGDGKPRSKLYHIAHEILTTERTFVNALRLVCDEFAAAVKQMMEKDPASLPKSSFSQMFDDLELIYDLDQKFLQELEDRMKDWDSHNRIGDIVRKYGYFLKMYTNYIKGYDKAMAVFQESCQKMPKFSALVKEYERKPSFLNLKVTSFMLKPIQRIPSYRLLLVDYLKHLPEDSEDHKDISNGLKIVSQVANHINESMKEGDKFQTMLKLQTRIVNSKEIVKPGRYLLKEGVLSKLSRKEAQERMFFLLTDCLLYCEHAAVSNQFKLREELPLAGMMLDVPESIDFNKEMTIISTKRSFTVVASSKDERDEWVKAIQLAIDDVSRKIGTFTIKLEHGERSPALLPSPIKEIGHIAPNWVPDARATMCCICLAKFTAYNRRHHCRACGEIVCNACSSYEAPLPYLNFDAARVCEKCYRHLYETLLIEEEQNDEQAPEPDQKSRTNLKRSKSAMSSKFKVIKKTKKPDRNGRKTLPSKLTEVTAQEQVCSISGYLFIIKKKKQKKRWFVLKDNALYSYKAPSDPAAHSTLAVLGYNVNVTGNFDAGDFVFQLEHSGLKEPFVYKADSRASAEMWVNALQKASQLLDR